MRENQNAYIADGTIDAPHHLKLCQLGGAAREDPSSISPECGKTCPGICGPAVDTCRRSNYIEEDSLTPDLLKALSREEERLPADPSRQRHGSKPSSTKIATYRLDVKTATQLDRELSWIIESELEQADRHHQCGLTITRHDRRTFTLAICGNVPAWEVKENDAWMRDFSV